MTPRAGRLYLIPAWLSEESPPETVIAPAVLERIRSLALFIVEDARSARRYLSACGHPRPMREIVMLELSEHTSARDIPQLLDPLAQGVDAGLLSEAGLPAVADPGAALVAAAHARGIAVVPLSGPSSILLALAASGLEGQRFRFVILLFLLLNRDRQNARRSFLFIFVAGIHQHQPRDVLPMAKGIVDSEESAVRVPDEHERALFSRAAQG